MHHFLQQCTARGLRTACATYDNSTAFTVEISRFIAKKGTVLLDNVTVKFAGINSHSDDAHSKHDKNEFHATTHGVSLNGDVLAPHSRMQPIVLQEDLAIFSVSSLVERGNEGTDFVFILLLLLRLVSENRANVMILLILWSR